VVKKGGGRGRKLQFFFNKLGEFRTTFRQTAATVSTQKITHAQNINLVSKLCSELGFSSPNFAFWDKNFLKKF